MKKFLIADSNSEDFPKGEFIQLSNIRGMEFKPKRKWLSNIITLVISLAIIAAIVWALMMGIVREGEYQDQLRKDRCDRFGETVPAEYKIYCADTGV